jgi:uncharacterized membrane protein
MDDQPRTNMWPRLAGVAGLVLAFVLTAVIWLQVIDRQATAMRQGDAVLLGTPLTDSRENPYPNDAAGDLRPIP